MKPPDSGRPDRRALIASAAAVALGAPRAGAQAPSASPSPAPVLLEARKADIRLRPAPRPLTTAWAVNGQIPGPILRTKQGEEVFVKFENKLEEPVSIHWRGIRNAPHLDGVGDFSAPPVAPGRSREIRFTARDAGLFLYEPCLPGRTAAQFERGLYGLLIVEERSPPPVDRDLAIVIDDWRLDNAGAVIVEPPAIGQPPRPGNLLTVNGASQAVEETLPPGGRARLRFVNASSSALMALRFEGPPATIVAIDGQPSSTAFRPKGGAVALTPGGRVEIMVDLPADGHDATGVFRALAQLTAEASFPVLTLTAGGERRPPRPPIAALPPNDLPERLDLARAQRVALTIEGGPIAGGQPSPWRLNGRNDGLAAPRPLFSAKRGATVVVAIQNRTAIAQAMRLHGHCGRLLFQLDDGWDPFWIDCALAYPGRTARLAFIADNPGKWALRSAFAELFDAGLAGWFEVV